MMMKSTLYKTNTLSWICIVLAHWSNSLRLDISPHSDTLSWFRVNKYLLSLLNAELININFIVFHLTRSGFQPTICRTRGEHTNLTPLMWYFTHWSNIVDFTTGCHLTTFISLPDVTWHRDGVFIYLTCSSQSRSLFFL